MTEATLENRTQLEHTRLASPESTDSSSSLEGKTAPGDRERSLDILQERYTREVKAFDVMMRQCHRIVPSEHPTHQHLQSVLTQAATMLGLESPGVNLVIFARYPYERLEKIVDEGNIAPYVPEAFVNPATGTVYLNVALLDACKYNSDLIHSVMYHELAHMVLLQGLREELTQSLSDPLGRSFRDYEVEYHCDRIAALISSKRGEDPRSISKALEAIEAAEKATIESTRLASEVARSIELPLISTHPATQRRMRANELVSHQMPVARNALTSAPTLQNIDVSTIPVTRPYGNLIRRDNSNGNQCDTLDGLTALNADNRPRQLLLTPDDYRRWCGEAASGDDNELIPREIRTLLRDPSVLHVSDWLREFAQLASTGTETLADVIDEFNQELESVSLDDLTTILTRINPARVLDNSDEPNLQIERYTTLPFCLSPLVNRFIQLKTEQGASSLECLSDLIKIAQEHQRVFGGSILLSAADVPILAIDICGNGSASDHEKLVGLILGDSDLKEVLISNATVKLADARPSYLRETSELIKPLLERYSPFRVTQDNKILSRHSMCAEIVPLSTDDEINQPTVLRRVPGGEFAIKTLERPGNLPPISLIEFGDAPLSERNIEVIKQTFLARFTDPFHAKLHSTTISNALQSMLTNVTRHSEDLLTLTSPSREERETFVKNDLATLYAQGGTTTSVARRFGRELTETKIRELFAATSIEAQIFDMGDDETTKAWIGVGRQGYSTTSYTRPESSSFDIFQSSLLFNDLHRSHFDSISPGVEKAAFLLDSYPIKVLERDQLLCVALGYPALECLNDMKPVEITIAAETDIHVLHILREGLKNQGLAQVAEGRLHEISTQDRDSFLNHPAIVALRASILTNLPEVVQDAAIRDERLLAILSAFTSPSRERDKYLREFIDHANSRALKEGLGALLADPIVSRLSPDIGTKSRVSPDTILSLISYLSPYDKAQALLYFMGCRKFESPTATWLLEGYDVRTPLSELQARLSLEAPTGKRISERWLGKEVKHQFDLPDCLVRAQKTFGISVATAENLQGSLLNERAITDLLTTILYGDSGVVADDKVRKEFFKLAGRTLIQTSDRFKELDPQRRKDLSKFVAFAFEQCPSEKLPTVIMRVWEATKGETEQLPSVVASILTGLGPAFVKFGQKLATLNIEAEYKKAFRQLSSENKEIDSTLVYHNTEAIFGGSVFEERGSGRKLGEGSMAATFVALPKGESEPRAIKIVHPFIEQEIEADCVYIQKLVEYINTHKPFASLTLPKNTATVIRQQLTHQIDTEREIANSHALASALRPGTDTVDFRVAKIDNRFSTKGVIAAEFLPGYELDKPEIEAQGYSSAAIRNEVGLEALRLLLTAPVYQSDVNLGNFGVLKNPTNGKIVAHDGRPTVVWYDAGAVDPISTNDQKLLLTIIKSAMKDPSSLPGELSKLVKDSDGREAELTVICDDLKKEWAGTGSFAPNVIKGRFERFFDKVSEAGLEIEERWLIVANTISMVAPLLDGVSSDRVRSLVVEALKHHKMLSFTERAALAALPWIS